MATINPAASRPIVHTVQGCQYSEFRGTGHPSTSITLASEPGDIYLDIQIPRGVWVYSGTSWIQWNSMEDSRSVPHPTLPRILCPNTERFAWVSNKGFAGFKRQVDLLLDGREDTAHVHVSNILDNEKERTESKAITTEEDESSSEEDESSSGDSEDESVSDDVDHSSSEHNIDASTKDDVNLNVIEDDNAMVVDDHEHDASDGGNDNTPKCTFEELCHKMRQVNLAIRKAAAVLPGTFCVDSRVINGQPIQSS